MNMIEETTLIDRNPTEPDESRAALVQRWLKDIEAAKSHFGSDFKRMKQNMDFAAGKQWPGQTDDDDRFQVNLVQRVIKTSVASLYAKNPTVIAKRRPRLDFRIWDGKAESLQSAQQTLMQAQQMMTAAAAQPEIAMQMGGVPIDMAAVQSAQALLADVQEGKARKDMMDRVGKTLVAVIEHYVGESKPGFKKEMKRMVRRARTAGVGYVKLGFQREMELSPEQNRKLADFAERLATIGRLQADIADGETDPYAAQVEELRLAMQTLKNEPERIIREGITFSFPGATKVIPSPSTESLMGWSGCDWIAEEIPMTPDRIKEVYGVDVASSYTSYRTLKSSPTGGDTQKSKNGELAMVYVIHDKATGMEMVVCDGYPDFLKEPGTPPIFIEQFFPIFALTFNDCEEEGRLFPKSDVENLKHLQKEYNRAKEAKRQHRIANRPLYVTPNGSFEEAEVKSLMGYEAHAVIQLNNLEKGRPASDLLQPVQKIGIDPNLYETAELYDDMQRVTGNSEASLGGTSGASATESSIAEQSRMGTIGLDSDDLDDMLSDLLSAAGQVALSELDVDTVKRIAGQGAVWPQMTRQEIAEEIYLEVKAGSSGRPNSAQDAAKFERIYPLMLQVPGISPRYLAERAITLADDDADLSEAIIDGIPSITAMNGAQRPNTGDPASDPTSQGGHGNDTQTANPVRDNGQPQYNASPDTGSPL